MIKHLSLIVAAAALCLAGCGSGEAAEDTATTGPKSNQGVADIKTAGGASQGAPGGAPAAATAPAAQVAPGVK